MPRKDPRKILHLHVELINEGSPPYGISVRRLGELEGGGTARLVELTLDMHEALGSKREKRILRELFCLMSNFQKKITKHTKANTPIQGNKINP